VRLLGRLVAAIRAWCGRQWLRATWQEVICPDCLGTGLCQANNPGPPRDLHSCCGDCARRVVTGADIPAGFSGVHESGGVRQAMLGTGRLYCRPWSPGTRHREIPR
jgi:hypothetical protein